MRMRVVYPFFLGFEYRKNGIHTLLVGAEICS